MTPKDPFLEGTFWDKFWWPIRSRALLFTPDKQKTLKNTKDIPRKKNTKETKTPARKRRTGISEFSALKVGQWW